MEIFLTALYIFIGITISISNKRMEEELEVPLEDRGNDMWNYFVLPIFWLPLLCWETYIKPYNKEE